MPEIGTVLMFTVFIKTHVITRQTIVSPYGQKHSFFDFCVCSSSNSLPSPWYCIILSSCFFRIFMYWWVSLTSLFSTNMAMTETRYTDENVNLFLCWSHWSCPQIHPGVKTECIFRCWKWDGMEWYAIPTLLHSAWNYNTTLGLINTIPVCRWLALNSL